MFHNFEEALSWIHSRLRLGIKPGLKRMEWMMERLGSPEKKLRTIHIGGTNGKGSTLTFLRTILQSAGYTVGTFTSPYIEQFNERISINGTPIDDHDLVKVANIIKPLSDELEETELGGPTEFEVITAMSFYYFAHVKKVDLALYEVGLGGRFDSTNIIEPVLSIITSIGLDHTSILGETYEEIAFEKAGIIKNNTPIITAVKQKEALQVIAEMAEQKKAPFFHLGEHFHIGNHVTMEKGEQFSFKTESKEMDDLEISMAGMHQVENASLAVMAAIQLNDITDSHIRHGLQNAYWPGRFEMVSERPLVILDGAHNEEGVEALVQALNNRYKEKKIKIIFAALHDKKLDNMIAKLDDIANSITFVDFDFPRAATSEQLYAISKSSQKSLSHDWQGQVSNQIKALKDEEVLVITGSLYFLSNVKSFLKESRF